MNSTERVTNVILGKPVDRQPLYGWVKANLTEEISKIFGSVENFEDHYEFDMSHIFGGPSYFDEKIIKKLNEENEELTPDILLEANALGDVDNESLYENVKKEIDFHKERDRFCYMQSPGFFECYNGVFGIQNQLMYLLMYEDEIDELYKRQADWTIKFADNCIDLGIDMVHISDDWGAQNNLMFNPDFWWEHIYPHLKKVVDHVHSRGKFISLHSDGNINKVTDGIEKLGINLVHPWQETAKMSYDTYLEKYSDKFAIMGGVCIQSTLGIVKQPELEKEIRRVFGKLKGHRWVCCTSHYVQSHCTMDDLIFAFDLMYKLARE